MCKSQGLISGTRKTYVWLFLKQSKPHRFYYRSQIVLFCFFPLAVLGIRTLCILGRYSASELHPQPCSVTMLFTCYNPVCSMVTCCKCCLQGICECIQCVMNVYSHICRHICIIYGLMLFHVTSQCCGPQCCKVHAWCKVLIFAPVVNIWAGKMHTYNNVVKLFCRLVKPVSYVWSALEIPAILASVQCCQSL